MNNNKNKRSVSSRKKNSGFSWSFLIKAGIHLLLLGFFIFFFFFLLVWLGLFGPLPSKESLAKIQNNTASEVFSSDGELMGRYFIENRLTIGNKKISPHVLNALVATEDSRFFEHKGIDYISLGRVLLKTLIGGNRSQGGGSTISQQLARNLYPRSGTSMFDLMISKAKESITAGRLEKAYTKEQVLNLYLNTVPFGEDIYGIETASQRFFSKSAEKLNPPEAATLIGMLAANTAYNPRLHPERSMKRRNIVMKRMMEQGWISNEEYNKWSRQAIELNYRRIDHNTGIAPYFRDIIQKELEQFLKDEYKDSISLYTDGLKIYTSIESGLQTFAEEAVKSRMQILQKEFFKHWEGHPLWKDKEPDDSLRRELLTLHSGFLAIDPYSGKILAWVGGIDHKRYKYDHVSSKRQVGSTFKPIVYAAALEKGLKACDFYPNEKKIYEEYDNWSPSNSHNNYEGYYSMKGALVHSVNTVSADIILETGINRVISLAKKLGISSDIPKVPSIALGTADISLKEMLFAYTAFLNEGVPLEPVGILRIEDNKGNVLYSHKDKAGKEAAMTTETAKIMLYMLKEVADSGTARSLHSIYKLKSETGGKTGTSQNNADGWFIGFTPNILAGCWVGAENPAVHFRTTSLGQGAHTALPIFARFIQKIEHSPDYRHYSSGSFPILPIQLEKELDCMNFSLKNPEYNFIERIFLKNRQRDSLRIKRKEERRLRKDKEYRELEKERIRDRIRKIFSTKKNIAESDTIQ